ncbi:class I SAM-dependent methyltransferase [Natronosalvus vescus]|uniref:class I SAM-dependent methyltransferase n=1 Tax=Natronosalvus vescus TaxID=2953881 RepID=UPI0020909FF3|nr:class I SAM-dependent methyltransferase [Natronosalvus vescus]
MDSVKEELRRRLPESTEPAIEKMGSAKDDMGSIPGQVFRRMPDGTKPLVQHGYHILNPGASWENMRRRERTRKHFKKLIGNEEYDRLSTEFFDESGITDIVISAIKEVGDEKVVFDTHRGVASHVYALIRTQKPDRIVSTGVYSGVGTASILLALDKNNHGMLHTVDASLTRGTVNRTRGGSDSIRELDFVERGRPSCSEHRSHELPPGKEPGWIIPDRLRERWESRHGFPQDVLPELYTELPKIDMFYHDSGHSKSGMLFEFELAWNWLKPGGMLISPHIDQNDAFGVFVNEHDCHHGLIEHDYLASSEYDEPCSCGYAVKLKN